MTRLPIDEQLMTDFLLGNLPEEEIERLDEMSLADDDFANRLQAVENDLVDAYIRGELSGTALTQFKSNYLRSSKRREKVEFAETLHKQLNKSVDTDRGFDYNAAPRSGFQWLLAAAAIVILTFCGYLVFQNVSLHDQIQQLQAEKESLRSREQELQKQIAQLKNQPSETKQDVKLLAFVLFPQTRGINKIPILNIPVGTDYIVLTLKSETNEFPMYQAALRDPAAGEIVWKSGNLQADKNNSVQVQIPASLLKQQNYLMELSGISDNGTAEIINSYPLRIATQ
ncbi:hypothetical protein L0152_15745 [bacterium]|nr:hypothetical protein [bacterium]